MSRKATARALPDRSPRVLCGDLAGLDRLPSTDFGVFCWSDVRPLPGAAGFLDWRMCGALSRLLETGAFRASPHEVLLTLAKGRFEGRRVFLFGLGPRKGCDPTVVKSVIEESLAVAGRARVKEFALLAVDMPGDTGGEQGFAKVARDVVTSKQKLGVVILREHLGIRS